jgi:hypothetical protein
MLNQKISNQLPQNSSSLNTGLYTILDRYLEPPTQNFIHISGENTTGKSILVKNFLHHVLNSPKAPRIFYIDTENKFSVRQYQTLFSRKAQNSVFLNQPSSISDFLKQLRNMRSSNYKIREGDYLVVDSISAFQKQLMVPAENYHEWKAELLYMTEQIVPQLISLAVRKGLKIILIHQVSYNPEIEANLPYYFDLFQQIKGIWVFLKHEISGVETQTFIDKLKLILHLEREIIQPDGCPGIHIFQRQFDYHISRQGNICITKQITPNSPVSKIDMFKILNVNG